MGTGSESSRCLSPFFPNALRIGRECQQANDEQTNHDRSFGPARFADDPGTGPISSFALQIAVPV